MAFFQSSTEKTDMLIRKNVEIKYKVVCKDEFETGERRLLNFGHTIGHAIENLYSLSHGQAVSIGMMAACSISEVFNNLPGEEKEKIAALLGKFNLPVHFEFDKDKVWDILLMDKKNSGAAMNFVLLNRIGEAVIKAIPIADLYNLFKKYFVVTVTINPSVISGSIYAPASKSSMQRACAAGLLTNGITIVSNAGKSNDDLAALEVIRKLGAKVISLENKDISIEGSDVSAASGEINCGESGLGLRMFAPIAALSHNEITLNGSGSLLNRPMDFFDEIFPLLDIDIKSNNGKLPMKIKGPLQPKNISIDGSLSSQFLTGLLMAYAKVCTSPVTIGVNNLKSRPYIDLTLSVMEHFGWSVENKDYREFCFRPAINKQNTTINYSVEGDWSSASFLLVAGVITGNVTVKGLDSSSTQADKAILGALKKSGAAIFVSENKIIAHAETLEAFEFDATDCPDLFPPLVALASYCRGVSRITGVSRLAHKESNRGLTLQKEFSKMGISILLQGDVMLVDSVKFPVGAIVHSSHDHRIAMACAVAALKAQGQTTIGAAEAVNKSYPDFYDHLKRLNASLQIT